MATPRKSKSNLISDRGCYSTNLTVRTASGVNSTFANIVIRYCRDFDLDRAIYPSKGTRDPREISSGRRRQQYM